MEANIAAPAALIGDPVRSAILLALLDDRVMPATALAWAAGVSPQSASNHLAKLVGGGLLSVSARGRSRYYRLAGPEVAHALEALAVIGPAPQQIRQPYSAKARRLREARSCYDHLAGRFGVMLADALEERDLIVLTGPDRYELTDGGRSWLGAMAIDIPTSRAGRKGLARPCIDWTERRRHLAGPLAAALMTTFMARGWITRGAEDRAILVTPAGHHGLRRSLGIDLDQAAAA